MLGIEGLVLPILYVWRSVFAFHFIAFVCHWIEVASMVLCVSDAAALSWVLLFPPNKAVVAKGLSFIFY